MSLNNWILGKEKEEIILEKIKKEIQKSFLTKNGTEFKYEKFFWIETLIRIITKNLSMNEDIVRKYIETLIFEGFMLKDYMDHVYYYPEITEECKNVIEAGYGLDHNSVLRIYDSKKRKEIRKKRIENTSEFLVHQ